MSGTVRYSTTVISVGPLVADFVGQGMLIIFGEGAPPELHDLWHCTPPTSRTVACNRVIACCWTTSSSPSCP